MQQGENPLPLKMPNAEAKARDTRFRFLDIEEQHRAIDPVECAILADSRCWDVEGVGIWDEISGAGIRLIRTFGATHATTLSPHLPVALAETR